ncbi:DUF1367 family protein [Brucella anthropi]|uniref:DUF1367 family protein n=1 Tax=Brucella anthropi TaxID=529 RepID=UPI002157146C|nr:DUF1367 family protein [Brucella anthropi]MCR8492795.1 DUF1367 family protein [Brucella anthropi]MDG9793034.1 DUF1367 family protein [Brucella anthropi]MDH0580192.1 DUF1367 family protein [Brucella anthropi]MDH0816816.1 DUF1367 family protein [Brucella anthropi]MDH2083348.1 DUF1367 family protein [Brucella anthropi]
MSKREKPVYGFVRKGNSLVPAMEFDMAALDGVAQGELVNIEIKQFRNTSRLRAYFAILREVINACDLPYTKEKLHEILKLQNGVIDPVTLPSGLTIAIPGSISFDKMSEAEFQSFFKKAEKWLAETYGYVREEVA